MINHLLCGEAKKTPLGVLFILLLMVHNYDSKNSVVHEVRINIRTNGKRQCCLTMDFMHPLLGMSDGLDAIMSPATRVQVPTWLEAFFQ